VTADLPTKSLRELDGKYTYDVERHMTRALVTGVTGFIGSHLAEALLQKGYDVTGLVRPCASRDLRPIGHLLEDITLVTCDLTNYSSVMNSVRSLDPDIIFHLAALSPVRYSFEHPFQYQETNLIGSINLAHSILEMPDFKRRRLIVASTAEVYGVQERKPFKETLPLNPTSPYAVSKAAMDMYVRMASSAYSLNCTILRPTNSYGRRFETGFIVEYLITTMLKGVRAYVGAPDSVRDYIHVTDHVNAYILATEKQTPPGEVYNAGSGRSITNRDLALLIAKVVGYDERKITFGTYPPGYPVRPLRGEQPYIVLDPSKTIKELGWRITVDLEHGIKDTVAYWKNRVSG
jgi:GDP-4-dehydro-6-deoxy-D-mannose reductase